jgi:hypothetical protein
MPRQRKKITVVAPKNDSDTMENQFAREIESELCGKRPLASISPIERLLIKRLINVRMHLHLLEKKMRNAVDGNGRWLMQDARTYSIASTQYKLITRDFMNIRLQPQPDRNRRSSLMMSQVTARGAVRAPGAARVPRGVSLTAALAGALAGGPAFTGAVFEDEDAEVDAVFAASLGRPFQGRAGRRPGPQHHSRPVATPAGRFDSAAAAARHYAISAAWAALRARRKLHGWSYIEGASEAPVAPVAPVVPAAPAVPETASAASVEALVALRQVKPA